MSDSLLIVATLGIVAGLFLSHFANWLHQYRNRKYCGTRYGIAESPCRRPPRHRGPHCSRLLSGDERIEELRREIRNIEESQS